ncbi:Putative F-box protein At1g12855 [Linum grandiflorum]
MNKGVGKGSKLLESVKERSMSKKVEDDDDKNRPVSYLDEACISSILMMLPLEFLPSLSMNFVKFSEGKGVTGDYSISCLGNIRAACNGFILLDNILKNGGLLVMNPVTRKMLSLPVGTLSGTYQESYGFASMNATSGGCYKLVHLFMDDMKYVGCEILNLGSRSWKAVNGPPSWLFPGSACQPVAAIGALHWLPQIEENNSMVSLELNTEKFHVIPLPKISGNHDRILEMRNLLCFITHEDLGIDIWKMKSLCHDDREWTKYHKITRGSLIDMVPLFGLRIKGDVVFQRHEDGSAYLYDFESQRMAMIEMDKEFYYTGRLLPHVNSLASWTTEA